MSNLRHFIERVLVKRQAQKPKLEAVQQDLRDLGQQLEHLRPGRRDVHQQRRAA